MLLKRLTMTTMMTMNTMVSMEKKLVTMTMRATMMKMMMTTTIVIHQRVQRMRTKQEIKILRLQRYLSTQSLIMRKVPSLTARLSSLRQKNKPRNQSQRLKTCWLSAKVS